MTITDRDISKKEHLTILSKNIDLQLCSRYKSLPRSLKGVDKSHKFFRSMRYKQARLKRCNIYKKR